MTRNHEHNNIENLPNPAPPPTPPPPPSPPPPPPSPAPAPDIILDEVVNPGLVMRWPTHKFKVPPIFLHKPTDFEKHVRTILEMGIKFYQPHRSENYIKIPFESIDDHKCMVEYLKQEQLPFHTFGYPSQRKMKVVIRGIAKDTELNKIEEVLKSASIPILEVHKMHTKVERLDNTMLVLAVVPYDDKGRQILRVSQILGHKVNLEPRNVKPYQCYRCQKWGHTQRYCYGIVRCVKCAGQHWTLPCGPIKWKEQLKCANCSKDHTANYKGCIATPGSTEYVIAKEESKSKKLPCRKPIQLVTLENCHMLYKNVDYKQSQTRKTRRVSQ